MPGCGPRACACQVSLHVQTIPRVKSLLVAVAVVPREPPLFRLHTRPRVSPGPILAQRAPATGRLRTALEECSCRTKGPTTARSQSKLRACFTDKQGFRKRPFAGVAMCGGGNSGEGRAGGRPPEASQKALQGGPT